MSRSNEIVIIGLLLKLSVISVTLIYNIRSSMDVNINSETRTSEQTIRQSQQCHDKLFPVDEQTSFSYDVIGKSTKTYANPRRLVGSDDVMIDWSLLTDARVNQQVDEFYMRLNMMELHSRVLKKSMNIIRISDALNQSHVVMATLSAMSRQLIEALDRLSYDDFVG